MVQLSQALVARDTLKYPSYHERGDHRASDGDGTSAHFRLLVSLLYIGRLLAHLCCCVNTTRCFLSNILRLSNYCPWKIWCCHFRSRSLRALGGGVAAGATE